ncbi:MAG: helix-turn-helix transcriptional regulator [Methanobacterium sp.]|uniref:winged helix-turn-helix transcriptional regulator n=1 Tax=Methanobacterium sp. TaxID=2164 RepID=UPI003D65C87E|nr:helix-turn-helix transcriptional regulator [Methanobacterium sp.]
MDKCIELCLCPLEGVIDIVSKKWTLLIINSLGNHGKLRFNELMKELEGVSPKTLSDTLKVLEAEGLIKRKNFKEIPPRVEYSLIEDGIELRKAILPLIEWASKRENFKKGECSSSYRPAHHINDSTL